MKQADAAGMVATTPTIQYDPFRTAELELQPSLGSASSAKANGNNGGPTIQLSMWLTPFRMSCIQGMAVHPVWKYT